ncbi:hypothetical protein A4S06_01150 [Erysipelotrichaceae bacterium MTC7]|nr:hypothetical protein A4S06_01150 [Erysipelotrichaceae bacterium MTC7]
MLDVLNQVKTIAVEAGRYFKEQRDFKINEKDGASNIVTSTDVKTQEMIIERLRYILPEAKIIAEENDVKDYDDGYVWVIDPIDGTTNFYYDMKLSCVSIALLYKQKSIMGVVYNPYLNELFYALKGEGSFLNGNPIQVNQADVTHSLFVVGTAPYKKAENVDYTFSTLRKLFLAGRDIRRSGSAVLDLCYVASGRVDGFFEASLSPWDFSAGRIIIEEAGGIIEPIQPDAWRYDQPIGIIAGNGNNFSFLQDASKRN